MCLPLMLLRTIHAIITTMKNMLTLSLIESNVNTNVNLPLQFVTLWGFARHSFYCYLRPSLVAACPRLTGRSTCVLCSWPR